MGRNVRGLNLINPHNPTGWIFPKEQIIRLCDWAARSGLFVIIDEIFSSCIHDPDAQFDSFLSYRNKLTNPEKVIYVWSPSKDFGLPGTKLATIHTEMPALLKSLNRLSSISPVSTMAEDFIVKLLSDGEFLTSFKRQMVSRLRAHFSFIAEHLKRLKIAFVPASAAIFVLIDLRKHLSRSSFEAEDELMHKLEGVGLYLTPGSHMEALQPGYFRLVFACSKEELKEGICRLYKFLGRDSSGVQDIEYEQ
ncbi:hypothetical protein WR25_16155 [Diploscapter pachys]|uniref:Aminotransferase class I/classII large domain-containing protein n=1 Tax=Diploscapter pachys TaxID=2018661 RepID=A0A2A2JNV0_9BILA|nr:hypothetical protein WR25_16155 [Diploscapter pachys]